MQDSQRQWSQLGGEDSPIGRELGADCVRKIPAPVKLDGRQPSIGIGLQNNRGAPIDVQSSEVSVATLNSPPPSCGESSAGGLWVIRCCGSGASSDVAARSDLRATRYGPVQGFALEQRPGIAGELLAPCLHPDRLVAQWPEKF